MNDKERLLEYTSTESAAEDICGFLDKLLVTICKFADTHSLSRYEL